jgi:hypothetical protein
MLFALFLTTTACDGDGVPAELPPPQCTDMVTTLVGSVPYNQWPAGADTAHATMNTMAGRYVASDSCKGGGLTTVKVTGEIPWESLPLVTTPFSEIGCGCTEDAAYSSDSEYTHIAQYDGATVFVEDGFEAGAENTTVFTDTALFGGSTPFLVRSCGGVQIEPYRGSTYRNLDVVFRIDTAGQRSGTYTLSNDDETVACELTNWVLEAVE